MDKINGYGRTDTASNSRTAGVKPVAEGNATRSNESEHSGTDAVSLTDGAVRLKNIEASLTDLADVDMRKVEAIREKIASGSYEFDGQSIAERLLQLEQDLA